MLSAIDHAVVVVSDLAAAMEALREAGFNVVPGGKHTIGTENALVPFADGAYLEIVGFREKNTEHRWWALLQRGGGVVDICASTSDAAADAAAFRKAGIPYTETRPLGRTRPDGYQLSFAVANPVEDVGVITFLCEDKTPRSERVPPAQQHANGASGLERVIVAVPDVLKARKCYEQVLGNPGREVVRSTLGARGVEFDIGRQKVEYLSSVDDRGEIARWLESRGPSVYGAVLRTLRRGLGRIDGANGARLMAAGDLGS